MSGAGGGKNDMERIGLFQEMGYVSIGDRYVPPGSKAFNEAAHKSKQMLPGGSKERSALQAGYFDEKFNRVFESEAYTDAVKRRRQDRLKEGKKNIGKAFLPSSGEKQMSGLGNHYGTLSGPVPAFSPVGKGGKEKKTSEKNVLTNPSKRGTGYGYPNLTIGKPYNYSSNPYDKGKELRRKHLQQHKSALKGGAFRLNMHPKALFDQNPYAHDRPLPPVKPKLATKKVTTPFKPSHPAKIIGGSKAGTFDPYPTHSNELFRPKTKKGPPPTNSSGKIFTPSPGPKSAPTSSIVNQNVFRTINSTNFRTIGTTLA